MKNLNILYVILLTILSVTAQADSVVSGTIPITWTRTEIWHDDIRGCFQAREEAGLVFYRQLSQIENLREPERFYRSEDGPINIDGSIQYACKEVIIKTTAQFNGLNRSEIKLEGLCIPRSLSEKQLISFNKKCESNPVETCFSENILRRLDAVKPTKVSMDHSSVCTSNKE